MTPYNLACHFDRNLHLRRHGGMPFIVLELSVTSVSKEAAASVCRMRTRIPLQCYNYFARTICIHLHGTTMLCYHRLEEVSGFVLRMGFEAVQSDIMSKKFWWNPIQPFQDPVTPCSVESLPRRQFFSSICLFGRRGRSATRGITLGTYGTRPGTS
jgi:hypothetical protein